MGSTGARETDFTWLLGVFCGRPVIPTVRRLSGACLVRLIGERHVPRQDLLP